MGGLKDYSVADFKELIPPLVNKFYLSLAFLLSINFWLNKHLVGLQYHPSLSSASCFNPVHTGHSNTLFCFDNPH